MRVKLVIINIVAFIASLYGVFYFNHLSDYWAIEATVRLCAVILMCSFVVLVGSAVMYLNKKIK
jgi:hypothetical protein